MMVLVVIALWLLIGVAVAAVESRRGHWRKVWVVGPVLGPFAVPLAVAARGSERSPFPRLVKAGGIGRGSRDVLVALDGSEASIAAAHEAVTLLGSDLHTLTLATVLDFDADDPPEGAHWSDEVEARTALATMARAIERKVGVEPSTVLLFGPPAVAIATYAADGGYDLVVAGRRGLGRSKSVLGSCASRLAGNCPVPVLLVPPTLTVDLREADITESSQPDTAG